MNILPLVQVDPKDLSLAGYKAASLSKLRRGNFSVPEGFVITPDACHAFFEENRLTAAVAAEMDKLNVADLHSVDYASRTITDLIARAEFPAELGSEILQQYAHLNTAYVAVRSSPYAGKDFASAWAGGLLTRLNVRTEMILQTVKDCWASLYSTRGLYYLSQLHIPHGNIAMPVLIQRMVEARVSGIAYSVHPVHRDRNQLVVEAVAGFGELLVAGGLTPDTYVVDKKERRVLERTISEQTMIMTGSLEGGTLVKDLEQPLKQPKLTEEQLFALTDLCVGVEKLYNAPVEIEWVYADEFYLVQARKMKEI